MVYCFQMTGRSLPQEPKFRRIKAVKINIIDIIIF